MPSIIRDITGMDWFPFGKVKKTLSENFMNATALPSWLESTAGTVTVNSTAASRGYVQIQTAATVNAQASLRCFNALNLTNFKAVLWTVEGFFTDSAQCTFAMGIAASGSVGAFANQLGGNNAAQTSMGGTAAGAGVNIIDGLESQRSRNIGMLLLPATRELMLVEDDQILTYRQGSTLTLGAVKPDLTVTTREAVAHNMYFSKLSLTVWHD